MNDDEKQESSATDAPPAEENLYLAPAAESDAEAETPEPETTTTEEEGQSTVDEKDIRPPFLRARDAETFDPHALAAEFDAALSAVTGGSRGRSPKYADTDRIRVLVEGNPKRAGSEQARLWAFYRGTPTVARFIELVGDAKTARLRLMSDVQRGLIAVKSKAA